MLFSGCNFPNCPRTSIYEASERDCRIVIARDALSQLYDKGEDEMENIGCGLLATSELVELLMQAVITYKKKSARMPLD